MKRRKCSNVRGYTCGLTCISRLFVCRKELTGQSVQIASAFAEMISSIPKSRNNYPDSFNFNEAVSNAKPNVEKYKNKFLDSFKGSQDQNLLTQDSEKALSAQKENFVEKYSDVFGSEAEDVYNAVSFYTGPGSKRIKKAQAENSGDFKKEIDNINKFIDNSEPASGVTYSGLPSDFARLIGVDKLKEGDTFANETVMSFSYDPLVAGMYAEDETGYTLIIENNTRGADVSEATKYGGEFEHIIKPGKYRVGKIYESDENSNKIILEEI